ncbi:MAG: hypothetical protein JXM79_22685 [Sedimentisphaerales bacterium]|nr:hypothetical protein [Sedimentisphaerales bacterium]
MAKKLKMSADGRTCAFPNCKNLLSIYNHEAYCHIHREKMAHKQTVKVPYHHFA